MDAYKKIDGSLEKLMTEMVKGIRQMIAIKAVSPESGGGKIEAF